MDYEVAIIGGGYCGLWTSVYLSEFGINNVVLVSQMFRREQADSVHMSTIKLLPDLPSEICRTVIH